MPNAEWDRASCSQARGLVLDPGDAVEPAIDPAVGSGLFE
jgi:hypothetical protein